MAIPTLEKFSPKQVRVAAHAASDYTFCASGGATRGGKSFPSLLGFSISVARNSDGYDSAIIGRSVEAVMRNVGFDLLKLFKRMGVKARLSRDFGTRIIVSLPGDSVSIWIVTAHDEQSKERIQGATLKFLLVEEATRIPESLWDMAWTRLSVPGAKCWSTHNPENPAHWWQRNVIDKIGEFDGCFTHFTLDDNPGLAEEYKARIRKSLKGAAYTRLVLGLPAATTGAIYPEWFEIEEPLEAGKINFGFDYGRSGVMAMCAVRRAGVYGDVVGEWEHDARLDGVLTDADYIERIQAFTEPFGNAKSLTVYADPSTPRHFKNLLKKTGMQIRDAKNDVIEGITVTAAALANGELRISPECTGIQNGLYNYVWDSKKSDLGIDAPVKENDHWMDTVRYECFSSYRQPVGKLRTVREVGF